MTAKVIAKGGQRDALVEYLLEGSRLLTPLPGCKLYIISTVASEPDAVQVFELWDSQQDHDASLQLDGVRAVIAQAKPQIASFEGSRLIPVGGKGLQ